MARAAAPPAARALRRAEPNGQAHPGAAGVAGVAGVGIGGGLDLLPGGTVTIDNTNITGNTASTSDNDVSGTFSV